MSPPALVAAHRCVRPCTVCVLGAQKTRVSRLYTVRTVPMRPLQKAKTTSHQDNQEHLSSRQPGAKRHKPSRQPGAIKTSMCCACNKPSRQPRPQAIKTTRSISVAPVTSAGVTCLCGTRDRMALTSASLIGLGPQPQTSNPKPQTLEHQSISSRRRFLCLFRSNPPSSVMLDMLDIRNPPSSLMLDIRRGSR
jgi:hypothetical protein